MTKKEMYARMHAEYQVAKKEIEKDFAKFIKDFVATNKRMLKQVEDGIITKDAYQVWYQQQVLHSNWAKGMIDQLSSDLTKADINAMKVADDAIPSFMAESENLSKYRIARMTGDDVSFSLVNERAVKATMDRNLLPVVDPERAMKWNTRRVRSAITQGVIQGKSMEDVAKNIQKVAGVNDKIAMRDARTAINGAENAGTLDAYKEAEALGLKITKVWLATMDDVTRDSHVQMDGEEVGIDEKFSNDLEYPCDPNGDPSEVYNCRCTMITKIDGEEIDMSGRINKTKMSYKEWKDAHKRQNR